MKKRKSLVQKVSCLWNSSQVHGRGHLLSKINGKVNIWTITSFSSLLKRFREEISLYSQILTVMQLLTKIYIKRIKLIHDYLCCYPKPDWLELNFFFYKWMEKRKAKSRDNHKWQKPSSEHRHIKWRHTTRWPPPYCLQQLWSLTKCFVVLRYLRCF